MCEAPYVRADTPTYNAGRHGIPDTHEKYPPVLSGAARRGPQIDARAFRRRSGARAHGAGGSAQPRFELSVPLRQLFPLPVRLSRARGRRRAGRRPGRRPARAVLPREERRAGNLGRLSLRPRRREGDLRVRRGASDHRARGKAAGAGIRPPRAVHAARPVRHVGQAGHAIAERGAQPRPGRRFRAGRHRRRARDRSTPCGSSRTITN